MNNKIKFSRQFDLMDCGPACIKMIASYYGKKYSLSSLRSKSYITRQGVSANGIREAAEAIGFEVITAKTNINKLREIGLLPCILHWKQNHFVVLKSISQKKGKLIFNILDPGHGLVKISEDIFKKSWLVNEMQGVAIFLSPTDEFYLKEGDDALNVSLHSLITYLKPYKTEVYKLMLSMFLSSFILILFPFLTQALFDRGVAAGNLNIIFLILVAQICLFFGSTFIDIIRNWITLFIGARINVKIISDFLRKMLKLPISFFESKNIGDFNQRISDHKRIETFLTSDGIFTLFTFFNFFVFAIVLFFYDWLILATYISLTVIAVFWIIFFLKKRKKLDYNKFLINAENQDAIYELINGIDEIKLNQYEDIKRSKWEEIQINLFKINSKILRLDQFQVVGFRFINQIKNIFVTYLAAKAVIYGTISIGEMLSITFIIGQLNSPINQLIIFFRSLQDAKISLNRLFEIQFYKEDIDNPQKKTKIVPNTLEEGNIEFSNLKFRYGGKNSPLVLKDINIKIPIGKTTAIVGESGSGKTTLLKLLLKFYKPTSGNILINDMSLEDIDTTLWRESCGTVLQDGYIFSDSIENNIATGNKKIDVDRIKRALYISNLDSFVNSLPLKLKTKIGLSGIGLSGGQKQRILLARAVYKKSNFLFFDEATSSLDAKNEREVMEKLTNFTNKKTSVIIAHRLSTVKNADHIIVLKDGEVVERGNHSELTQRNGVYLNLIKNQLELSK